MSQPKCQLNDGGLTLPSVKDLLLPMRFHPTSIHGPAQNVLCQPCLARQETVTLRPGEACQVCRQHSQLRARNLEQPVRSPFETPVRPFPYGPGSQQAYMNPETPQASPLSTVLPPPPHFSLAYHGINQDRAVNFGQPTPPRMHSPARFTTTQATKAAQNDRHKLSEKHRRDGMGAFVQAGHALRDGLNPGLLSGCQICIRIEEDESDIAVTLLPNPSITTSHGASELDSASPISGARNKKPKNDMLEEGLLWDFNMILHHTPEAVGERLESIRALALEMDREKNVGIASDHARIKKWSSDVRGIVLWEVLDKMESVCRAHSVSFEGARKVAVTSEWPRKRRNEPDMEGCEERYKRRDVDVPTPPSSRASSLIDARRSSEDLEILK